MSISGNIELYKAGADCYSGIRACTNKKCGRNLDPTHEDVCSLAGKIVMPHSKVGAWLE